MAADRGLGPARPAQAKKNFARVVKITKTLPGVETGVTHRNQGILVNGKSLGIIRPDAEFGLACANRAAKDFLLETQPDAFWQPPHYAPTPWCVVRMDVVTDQQLFTAIEASWREKAPKKVVAAYQAKAPAKVAAKTARPKKAAAKKAPAPRAAKDHFARVVKIAGKLPGVEVGTAYGTPGIRVRKKFLCRMKEDGETLVVIAANLDEKEFLMSMEPAIFYETPHYHGHAGVLMHLSKTDDKRLFNMLEAGWKRNASKKMLAEYEAKPAK